MTTGPEDLLLPVAPPLDGRRFELAVKRLADSLGYGSDRSPFVGSGLEYVQSRPYQPGDPVKSIDWRVTARTRRVHVKEWESPRRMPVLLLVDGSASMVVASGPRSKYSLAVHVASGLALASLERVSPVGVLAVGGRPLNIRPSLSRDLVWQWLHQLRRHTNDAPTTLAARVAELAGTTRERSVVIALSDLHDPAGVVALAQLAQRHDVVAIQLQDPAEEGVARAGLLRAREAETGRALVGPSGRALVDAAEVGRTLRRKGVDHLLLRTDRPFLHALRHFLAARRVLGRGAR